MNDDINSPGQPRQPETPAIGAGDGCNGATFPAPEAVKPMTMGRYAQKVSFNKGDYFSHDNKLYYKSAEGKLSHVTGAPEGDRELMPEEAVSLVAQKSTGNAPPGTAPSSDETSGPRPAPTPRKRPEMHSGEMEPGANPLNPPYDPESERRVGQVESHCCRR
ncbi:MAG: hypothetical protein ACOZEN_14455 [Thermodesulfobacteriota bacterium]